MHGARRQIAELEDGKLYGISQGVRWRSTAARSIFSHSSCARLHDTVHVSTPLSGRRDRVQSTPCKGTVGIGSGRGGWSRTAVEGERDEVSESEVHTEVARGLGRHFGVHTRP